MAVLGLVALSTGLLMGRWALPLWLNNPILAVTQFPWRLLAVTSLPLALFAGGIVLLFRNTWLQIASALLLLGMIIVAQQPRVGWMDVFAAGGTEVSLPVFAQVEVDKGILGGGEGNSSIQEFRPRWVDRTLVLSPTHDLTAQKLAIQLVRGNAYDLTLRINGETGSPLRFNNFYFPGWQVTLDQDRVLKTYPSTNLGLLTVDVPAGAHVVQLVWAGTPVQRWAGVLSLLTLAALTWLAWRQQTKRWLALVPCLFLLWGVTAFAWPRPSRPIEPQAQTIEADHVRLLGLRTEQSDPAHLYLYPYWHATSAPPQDLRMKWKLLDEQGAVKTETLTHPYLTPRWPATGRQVRWWTTPMCWPCRLVCRRGHIKSLCAREQRTPNWRKRRRLWAAFVLPRLFLAKRRRPIF